MKCAVCRQESTTDPCPTCTLDAFNQDFIQPDPCPYNQNNTCQHPDIPFYDMQCQKETAPMPENFAFVIINPDGTAQEQHFQSADAALSCMYHRTKATTYEQLQELGFTLARVKINMEIVSTLK